MIRGIIFDMDGVVIDSNHIHYENWNGIFKKKFDKQIPKEEFASRLGESSKHFTDYFINKYDLDTPREELYKELKDNHKNHRDKIKLKEGIKKTLVYLKEEGYKIALATGADKSAALFTVENFNIADYFDFIIGGDEVNIAKPNPEIFLKAAEGLKLRPEECIVIEDALMGIKAAKSAGIKVISIQDELTKYQDHSMADYSLENIEDLNKEFLDKIKQKVK